MTRNFEGHKLVAVGGSSGMGRDSAADVVAGGGSVVIIGREQARVDETVATLSKDGQAWGITADLADREQVARVQQHLADEHADATLLVNAAGFFIPKPFLEYDGAFYDSYVELDRAIFFLTQTVVRGMVDQGRGGAIVNLRALLPGFADLRRRGWPAVRGERGQRHGHRLRGEGDQLRRTQVVASGGDFPVSVTAEHGLVYVLNGGGDGSVSGYRVNGDQLVPISGSIRSLGLNNTTPPNFLSSPGQVTLSPSGGQLIIPTKSNGVIDVFRINPTGRPSDPSIQNPSAGAVPFTASFDASGHLIVTEAGGVVEGEGSVSSYVLNPNGTLTTVSAAVANGQTATCWDAFSRGFLYAVNTGSSTISGYVDAQGSLSLLDPSGVTAPTNAGPIDVASSGRFLYVEESLTGTLGEFSVASDGSLTRIGMITGLPVFSNGNGMEGIAAA